MTPQVEMEDFTRALRELGHDPDKFRGQKISLQNMARLYHFEESSLREAVEKGAITAHYDYRNDVILVDALEAAHFYYCVHTHKNLMNGDRD
ncbi:MAG: hypothetical protein HYW48_04555 [Deltaproteobacteria bacterium]|nr:hypothetical protein [Deltaproteobacteria bacterium]